MSLKPPKHSEKKNSLFQYGMKKRRENTRELLPQYYLIVCEGTKTEPLYFKGIKEKINTKYPHHIDVEEAINIQIEGEGTNTLSLLKRAKKYVANNPNHYSHVWLVYDQDDFPKDNFDNTEFSAESLSNDNIQYHVAWSNQCIEIWFLLHFQDLYSDLDREMYNDLLKEHFVYEKNLPDIFEILCDKGSLETAIRRAEKLYQDYDERVPSKMSPATRVHELVKDLMKYL